MMWVVLFAAIWLALGVVTVGRYYAYLQREWPTIAHLDREGDRRAALWFSLIGPFGLMAWELRAGHGWLFPFEWGGKHGHRGSEANSEGGAGAVQAPPNSPSGAIAPVRTVTPPRQGGGVPVETQDTEIVAWRAWIVVRDGDDWYLRSFYYPEANPMRWEGPVVRADKEPTLHTANGIYALTEQRFNLCYSGYRHLSFGPLDGRYKVEGFAYGEVALSGTVIEGTSGYRAEQAVVRSLTLKLDKAWEVGKNIPPLVIQSALEDRYQCPVTLHCGEVA